MDKVHAKARCVPPTRVAHIVAQLIFLLIAQYRKGRDRGYELVVTVGFESADGTRGGSEGKRQRKSQGLVAGLREVQEAGVQDQRSEPILRKGGLLSQHKTEVIIVAGRSRRGQCALLHQRIVRGV